MGPSAGIIYKNIGVVGGYKYNFNEQESTTDSSFISNTIAYSSAKWSDGKMYHSLGIYPNSLFVNTIKLTEYITQKIPVPYEVEVPVEVEKKLTLLQRLKMRIGEIALAFILLYGLIKGPAIIRKLRR